MQKKCRMEDSRQKEQKVQRLGGGEWEEGLAEWGQGTVRTIKKARMARLQWAGEMVQEQVGEVTHKENSRPREGFGAFFWL